MRLLRADLDKVDMGRLRPYAVGAGDLFAPKQHYRLIAHLSTLVKGTIIDIGTHLGDSAVALSYGGNPVESFDIVDNVKDRALPPNVRRHFGQLDDLWTPMGRANWNRDILGSPLIFLDIDPHEGTRELEFAQWLYDQDYRGLLVVDDIWHFKSMRDKFWSRVHGPKKTDVTSLGHWSGTGILSYVGRGHWRDGTDIPGFGLDGVEVDGAPGDTSNWTLVTGYFDLTKKSDANDAIRARPMEHYIEQYGGGTLGLDQNLVVFCDPDLESAVWAERPKHLHEKTRVVALDFETFPLTKYREKIIANRGGVSGCSADPRNTASYYLFCMARYAMVKQAIRENPFGSTHFAWINICIERMGVSNLIHLSEALAVQRAKFSTCFIDYVSKETTQDLAKHFGPDGCKKNCGARCSMCSGFFTGSASYMKKVCDLMEDTFVRCTEAGFGHADEQLMPIVYWEHPELFDWYVGDYAEMITNYAWVRERPGQPIANLIRNSLAAGDHEVSAKACAIVRASSWEAHQCKLSAEENRFLFDAFHESEARFDWRAWLATHPEPDRQLQVGDVVRILDVPVALYSRSLGIVQEHADGKILIATVHSDGSGAYDQTITAERITLTSDPLALRAQAGYVKFKAAEEAHLASLTRERAQIAKKHNLDPVLAEAFYQERRGYEYDHGDS